MGKVLTRHLHAKVNQVKDCKEFNLSELRVLQTRLFEVAEAELDSVYQKTNDNRRERHASLQDMAAHWSNLTFGASKEAMLVLRDALCHEVVMRFVHHTTESKKALLQQDPSFIVPTLPTWQHSNNGQVELQAAYREYVAATGCQACHSRLVPLPSLEPSQSCRAQITEKCGKYGQQMKDACTKCVQQASTSELSACSDQEKGAWCNHPDACSGADECPVWPDEFSAPFTLYSSFPSISAAKSLFYYKYTSALQAQTVDYHEKCFPFVNLRTPFSNLPCKLFFNPKGIYLSQPGRVDCCKFKADVGAVPPQFLQSYKLSAQGVSKPDMYGGQIKTDQWDGPSGFQYWTSAKDDATYGFGHDIVFKDGPTGVTWRWGNFSVVPQEDKLFDLPAGNCEESCPKFLAMDEISALHSDPHVRHVSLATKAVIAKAQGSTALPLVV